MTVNFQKDETCAPADTSASAVHRRLLSVNSSPRILLNLSLAKTQKQLHDECKDHNAITDLNFFLFIFPLFWKINSMLLPDQYFQYLIGIKLAIFSLHHPLLNLSHRSKLPKRTETCLPVLDLT
jgi:hypothetical protein